MGKTLQGFDERLSTLLIGVDSLFGGDDMHESGTRHVIADTWTSGYEPPKIYHDETAQVLREKEGIEGVDKDVVNGFVKKYKLLELPDVVREDALSFQTNDPDRTNYIHNLVNALEVMLHTAIAISNGTELPSYDTRYRAATAGILNEAFLIDTKPGREHLKESLAKAGYKVTNDRNLRETMKAWHHDKGNIPSDELAERVNETTSHLLQLTRDRIFSQLDFGIPGFNRGLSDVNFDGFRFETLSGVHFTGSSIYHGGVDENGKPLLKQLFEYNTDHPVGKPGLYHLCGHEVVPGHYLQSAVGDLLWMDGRLGFESTIGVMCTPETVFREGWAQNAFNLLFGSREAAISEFGDDLRVELAYEDLQDIGKHNASILYQKNGESLDRVRQHVAEECVQMDPIVKKLSSAWATHPIIGPMYGPAYWLGRTIIQKAIEDVGREKVARIGFMLDGLVDIKTFQDKVYR